VQEQVIEKAPVSLPVEEVPKCLDKEGSEQSRICFV
jgi:hypothetical protein